MGASLSWHSIKPSLYWSNILNQWANDQKNIYKAVFEDYYKIASFLTPQEKYRNKVFANSIPEISIFNKMQNNIGGSLWMGTGKTTSKRFYYGIEGKIEYKKINVNTKNDDVEIYNSDKHQTFYLRHIIEGKVTYASHVIFKKNFEIGIGLKLGYFPINRFLAYTNLEIALHQNTYDKLFLDMKSNLNFKRLNDDSNSKSLWDSEFMKKLVPRQCTTSTSHHFYMSLNLGIGFDYFLNRKLFIQTGYKYKISFSDHLRKLSDTSFTSDPSLEDIKDDSYTLRYQDRENCLLFGIGRKF